MTREYQDPKQKKYKPKAEAAKIELSNLGYVVSEFFQNR
jgi:hypothetical protein